MKKQFLDKKIDYDGSQLRSHWIFDNTEILGDAVVAFRGRCNVSPEYMADLMDKNAGCKIYSDDMLHFIIEHFDRDLKQAIFRQRLFVAIVKDVIEMQCKDSDVVRRGNDLFDGDKKINISIASASPVSTLIHVGINVSSENTPVKTKSLNDFGINPKIFAEEVMKGYISEIEGIDNARCKVKWIR